MASEIRVDKINSLSGVGTVTLSPTGVDIAGITTAATLRATTGIVTSLTAGSLTSLGAVSGTTGTFTGDVDIADKIVHTGDTDTAIRFSGADTITAETGGSSRFKIDSSGNVTIGNDGDSGSNPSSGYDELCIEGGNEAIGMCFLSPAANDVEQTIAFGDSNNNQSGKIQYEHANDAMHFDTAGTERARIESAGNVKIEKNLNVVGVCTATSFSGDGSNLSGISVGITTEAYVVQAVSGITTFLDLSKDDHKIIASGITTVDVRGGTEASSHTLRIENSGITTVGFSTYFLFPSGGTPNLPTTDGAISLISFTIHRAGAVGLATQLLSGASVNFS